ncbi:MAG: DUF4037 domain-containing protein [Clostridia bacterium]|nr:DUF4037 domain-containing protein [Clostridia bacterium]
MKGLEIAEKYYLEYGAPMLAEQFPELEGIVAAGLVGSGSECLGYDDEISRDHDFEPGFVLFLPPEEVVDRSLAFKLERAYAKLPTAFMGLTRNRDVSFETGRHGVVRAADFFRAKVGDPEGDLSLDKWLTIPEHYLLEVTDGKIFRDDLGIVTDVRKKLAYFPEDVRLKKLAGALMLAEQAAGYNYERVLSRGDTAAAQLAIGEYVREVLSVIFLLARRYKPFYKWQFRALDEVETFAPLREDLESLLSTGNGAGESIEKLSRIRRINAALGEEIRAQGLSDYDGLRLDSFAYCVNGKIKDPSLRNMHVMAGAE